MKRQSTIQIADKCIFMGGAPFIIAEVGINHNGDLNIAKKMIDEAKRAGADAVKFQTFKADEFCIPGTLFTYKSQGKEVTESMLDMFKRYEFSLEQWIELKVYCEAEKIMFFSTPQNYSDLELLLRLGVPVIKVGSDDFTNLPLLRKYAATQLPLILSCGMSDLSDVQQALDAVGWVNGYPLILLVCTSQYPTPPEHANLRRIQSLQYAFPGLLVGFSDHTEGVIASIGAAALGACVFEKHFTLSHDLPGPDHWFSANPTQLSEWVSGIRGVEIMLGDGVVQPSNAEREMRKLARRSLVILKPMVAGDVFSEQNLGLRRPGTGMPPDMIEGVFGLKSARALTEGTLLSNGDIQW